MPNDSSKKGQVQEVLALFAKLSLEEAQEAFSKISTIYVEMIREQTAQKINPKKTSTEQL